jgi:hypothetical protein
MYSYNRICLGEPCFWTKLDSTYTQHVIMAGRQPIVLCISMFKLTKDRTLLCWLQLAKICSSEQLYLMELATLKGSSTFLKLSCHKPRECCNSLSWITQHFTRQQLCESASNGMASELSFYHPIHQSSTRLRSIFR